MTDVVLLINRDNKISLANPAACRLLEFGPMELEGRFVHDILLSHEQAPVYTRELFDRMKSSAVMDTENFLKQKSGRLIPVSISLAAIRDEHGAICALICVARDLRERKEVEAKEKELFIREKALRERLQHEGESRITFTRQIIHELKSQLSAILAASEFMIRDPNAASVQESLVKSIFRSATNLDHIINDLLDLARGEVGVLKVNIKATNPLPTIQALMDEIRPIAEKKSIALLVETPPVLPNVLVDVYRLRQVLYNYISNAIRYTPNGGRITVTANNNEKTVQIEVEDNGQGISETETPVIFDPRLRTSLSYGGGLGIGLALVKMLIELHGGEVWGRSEEGKGSTFGFSIPLVT